MADTNDASSLTQIQPPNNFDFTRPEQWPSWEKRFKRYLNVTGLVAKSNVIKIDVLCYSMGEKSEEILAQVMPDVSTKSLEEVLKAFKDYFAPKKNVIFERACFNTRSQAPGETVDNFITALHTQAEACDYGNLKNDLIRDRIVIGIADSRTSEQLQLMSDLTLDKAVSIVRVAEQQQKHAQTLKQEVVEVDRVYTKNTKSQTTQKQSKKHALQGDCPRCGLSFHRNDECPAKATKCRNCKKMGHWDKVCRTKSVNCTKANDREDTDLPNNEEENHQEYFLGHVSKKHEEEEFVAEVYFREFSRHIECMIDNGADVTCIRSADIPQIMLGKLKQAEVKIIGPEGMKLQLLGKLSVKARIGDVEKIITLYVIRDLKRNLLGKDSIREFQLVRRVRSISQHNILITKSDVEHEFPSVFGGIGKFKQEFCIRTVANCKPFCQTVPRVVPIPLLEKLKKELNKLEKEGIIVPVKEPSTWCSPIVCVPKGESIRLCCDFTELNKNVLRSVFPLPKIDVTLAQLKGSKYFSKLDANAGFYQVKLAKESQLLTTFITPFMFTRLPFGINCAPDHFSESFYELLRDLRNVKVHVDDVLIYAPTIEDHNATLKEVLTRLKNAGVTLNQEKCLIGVSELNFLGHVVSERGVKIDPQRVSAINNYPPPNNKKSLLQFLGMVNFAAKFIPNRSELLEPLNALLKNNSIFVWDAPQVEAFSRIKHLLESAPCLAYFDYSKKICIQSDASSYGIGYALLQGEPPNREIVAYGSRALSATEQRYSQIEKETLALTVAAERFKDYITGIDIILETDHKPLLQILQTTPLDDLTPRLQRFRIRLMRYSYKIVHIPGKELILADALSRNPEQANTTHASDIELEKETATFFAGTVKSLPASNEMLHIIQTEQVKDPTCQKLIKFSTSRWPAKDHIEEDVREYLPNKNNISYGEGFLLYKSRLIIPRTMQLEMLHRIHTGHLGINKCRNRAKQSIWWLGLSTQLKNLIENCPNCVEHRTNPQQPFVSEEFPKYPWQKIGIDLFKCEKWYVIFSDYYSRYSEIVPVTSFSSSALVEACKELFSRFGIPEIVRTDNGPQFTAEFKKFAKNYDFQNVTSSPHFPQSNGAIEAAVAVAKNIIKKSKSGDINQALLAYRTTPLENGFSPAQLVFGRKIRSNVPILPSQLKSVIHDSVVQAKEKNRKEKQNANFNRRHRTRELSVLREGETVWVVDLRVYGRVVKQLTEPRSYLIQTETGQVRRNRWHLIPAPYKTYESLDTFRTPILEPENEKAENANSDRQEENLLDVALPSDNVNVAVGGSPVQMRSQRTRKKPGWLNGFLY